MQCTTRFPFAGWILLALFGILLMGCEGSTSKQKALAPNAKILAFGDSLTFGKGVLPEESYPARLQAAIHRDVINGGLPGEVSVEGLKRLPIWLDEYEPNLLILCHGANDLLRSLNEDKIRDNLRGMVKLAKDRGVDVILIAVPKFGGMRSAPGFYADVAREFNIPLENRSLEEILRHAKYHKDTVHPNPEGYQLIADALVKLMQASGAL